MNDKELSQAFWRSWMSDEGVNSFASLRTWIAERNANTPVGVQRISLERCAPWHYNAETGRIENEQQSFFQIAGLRMYSKEITTGELTPIREQPIIIQDEIGFLGIVCKEFDGVMHFLMQAKIEPGNVNKVQISPTTQATRSNFMRLHGGKSPRYLRYFTNPENHTVVVDQIQSEQSSRFLGKRNRNMVVVASDDVPVLPTHRWMTLGQIMHMMEFDNLVNMDARTVLSCLPWSFWREYPEDMERRLTPWGKLIANSYMAPLDVSKLNAAYRLLNDYKTFDTTVTKVVPLSELTDWIMLPYEIRHRRSYPFKVIYCDVNIEGREVQHWTQPLMEAKGQALFALLACRDGDAAKFLVRINPEIGCFDKVEFAPTVQREAGYLGEDDAVQRATLGLVDEGKGVMADVLLSEEGGRFYCEQNRNVILLVDELPQELRSESLPSGYIWLDLATLNLLMRAGNVLNIQLRNLLSLLRI
ncbi:MAG: NDP-hexose 2,3-dehydratase family protein [Atopobiaceae bacterium]|nr:NDP-hexose 2,3-dehydratase family protein [Atopobiaceae bacterium]